MNSNPAFRSRSLRPLSLALTLTVTVTVASALPLALALTPMAAARGADGPAAGASGALRLATEPGSGRETLAGFAWDGFGTNLLAPGSAGLLLDGKRVAPGFGRVEECSGRGWRCRMAVAELPEIATNEVHGTVGTNQLARWERRVVEIESGLVVIFDDVVLRKPAVLGVVLRTVAAPAVDPRWKDLRLQLAGAGWTAIALGEPALAWTVAEAGADENALWESRATGVAASTTARRVTVLAAQGSGPRVSVVAKLLQSDSAFGVRVHRDGLPVLAAFRVAPGAGPATLAGFEFTGPVGVDVFRPKAPRVR